MLHDSYYRYINFTELNEKSPMYEGSIDTSIELKPHQLTLINKCLEREQKHIYLQDDPCINDKYLSMKTDIGIIADKVGSGKSYVVLGIIASNKVPVADYQINSAFGFGHVLLEQKKDTYFEEIDLNIIVIPHTLTKQWIQNIEKFSSNLSYVVVNRTSCMTRLEKSIRDGEHKIILVTGNFYKQVRAMLYLNRWKVSRVFFDEVDSTNIPSANYVFCRFMWFVTASYKNVIFPFQKIHYDRQNIANSHVLSNGITNNSFVKGLFISLWKSMGENEARSVDKIIIKNNDKFVDESFKLPDIKQHIIHCRMPIELYVLSGVVNQDIIRCLNAGDVNSAKQYINEDNLCTEESIIDKVLQEFNHNLTNLEIKLESTTRMFFSNENRRTAQRTKIIEQIDKIKKNIDMITNRLNSNGSLCPICYSEPQNKCVSKCCSNSFCFQCITQWLSVNSSCPLCKSSCDITDSYYVIDSPPETSEDNRTQWTELFEKLPGDDDFTRDCDKLTNLKRILKNRTSSSKFLIFSEFEQSFVHMYEHLKSAGITYAHVKGNSAINNIDKYKNGNVDALLVNSRNYASGINLENTTDVILFHKFETQIEKQIIGRAQRPGRDCSLNVWYLLNENELH